VGGAIIIEGLSKRFPMRLADRPMTLQEIFQRGTGSLRVSKHFWALKGVSFRVKPGHMVGVIGSNGAGKSTLLRIVAGVGRPTTGRVELKGRVGAILDLGVGFHPELTGRENVFVSGVTSGLTRREVTARFDSIVSFSGIEEFIDNPLRTYSSGMHMRLAFAVASHVEPEILLIDEVLAVGDYRFQEKCMKRLVHLRDSGCTGLIVSHAPEQLKRLCDRAIWLHDGRLVAHGSVEEVAARYLAAMDEPAANRASKKAGSAEER
jgi:lipopolysaccharide transport system ATP-binding protein